MLGTLHPDEVEDLLFRHHVGHLACVADGHPYVVPITYAYDTGSLYGQTVPGRKLAALHANPAICFAVTDHPDAQTWRSVVAEGSYEEVPDGPKRAAVRARLAQVGPVAHPGAATVVFRLHLTSKQGRWLHDAYPR